MLSYDQLNSNNIHKVIQVQIYLKFRIRKNNKIKNNLK